MQITEKAIGNSGFDLGRNVAMGIDFASSSLWDDKAKKYDYRRKGKALSSEDQIDYVNNLIKSYKLLYVEDPVNEEDFQGCRYLPVRTLDVLSPVTTYLSLMYRGWQLALEHVLVLYLK